MNEAMMIQGTALQIKEYKGKRVVTFKDIDTVHQRPLGTANKRFIDNRQRFISGVDFFLLSKDEILSSEFRNLATNNRGITLITETGYMMLVKSFTDDLAWKVQRELVDTYFKIRAEPETIQQTVTVTEPIETQNPEILVRAVEALAGCLEGNRPYVLNILRHIVPDIDQTDVQEKVTEVTAEVSTVQVKKKNRPPFWKHGVEIDVDRLRLALNCKHMTTNELAYRVGVCIQTANSWVSGKNKPVQENLVKICAVLGEDDNFLTPKRTRRRR